MAELNFYTDQLSIDTPEQVELRFPIAGVGSRFIAILLDSIIQLLTLFLVYLLFFLTTVWTAIDHGMNRQSDTAQKWLVAAMIFAHVLLIWGYFVLFEAYWKGQTPGKRVMKLRVLKDSGRSITLFESMARNLIRVVDYFPSLYLTGLITMLCNRRNKRLGDYVAGTIVVHEQMDEQPVLTHASRTFTAPLAEAQPTRSWMPGAQEAWEANSSRLPADAIARLGSADLHVIETFFGRALDLPVSKREELSLRLAQRMSEKMGAPLPEGMQPERVLELIVFQMRAQGR
jgi:uncharacterized RDD family membrane protein YckC